MSVGAVALLTMASGLTYERESRCVKGEGSFIFWGVHSFI